MYIYIYTRYTRVYASSHGGRFGAEGLGLEGLELQISTAAQSSEVQEWILLPQAVGLSVLRSPLTARLVRRVALSMCLHVNSSVCAWLFLFLVLPVFDGSWFHSKRHTMAKILAIL